MKKPIILAVAFSFGIAAMAQGTSDQPSPALVSSPGVTKAPAAANAAQPTPEKVAKFNVETYDFKKIKQGTPVTYSFVIKNISKKPLVVENSWASCGCTTPEKITAPIMPGKTAKLKVQFNAAAVAPFTKEVFVQFSGVNGPKKVVITGEVLTPENYDEWVKTQPKSKATTKAPVTTPKAVN